MTLGKVLIDFTDVDGKVVTIPPGSFYVAITRVKRGDDFYLTKFTKSFIKVNQHIEQEMKRLNERATYQFNTVFLDNPVFDNSTDEKEELILTYLNINGLLNKRLDLESDRNISHSDILCIAETKLSEEVNNNALQLSSFEILGRIDGCGVRSMGMMIYVNKSSTISLENLVTERFNHGKVEVIHFNVQGMKVLFSYIHPIIKRKDMISFEDLCLTSDIVMGDLNINIRDPGFGKKTMDSLMQNTSKIAALDDVTFDRYSQPDHILVDKSFQYPY
mgnify:FL=1